MKVKIYFTVRVIACNKPNEVNSSAAITDAKRDKKQSAGGGNHQLILYLSHTRTESVDRMIRNGELVVPTGFCLISSPAVLANDNKRAHTHACCQFRE